MEDDIATQFEVMVEAAGWWQEQFNMANIERNELKKKLAKLEQDYYDLKNQGNTPRHVYNPSAARQGDIIHYRSGETAISNGCDCGQPSCAICHG